MDRETALVKFITIGYNITRPYSVFIYVPCNGYPYLLGVTLASFLDGMKISFSFIDRKNKGRRKTEGAYSLITQIVTLLTKSPENNGDAYVCGEPEMKEKCAYNYTITLNEDEGTITIKVESEFGLYEPLEKRENEETFREREKKFEGQYTSTPAEFVNTFACLSSVVYKPILPSKKRKGSELKEDKRKVAKMFFDTIQQGRMLDNREDKAEWIRDNRDILVAMLDEICYRE